MSAAKLRILVAEDEPTQSTFVMRLLQKNSHEVTCVSDGDQAVEKLGKNDYDVVLLDWMLPKVDGIEIARLIKKDKKRSRVIMMSVLDLPLAREHARAAGASTFLSKPLVPQELMKALERAGEEPAPANDTTARHPIAKLAPWGAFPAQYADVIKQICGCEAVGSALGNDPLENEIVGAECPLLDAVRNLELRVGMYGTTATTKFIATKMFDDPSAGEEEIQGALTEMTNVLAGAMKTAFQPHGYSFTLGLPKFRTYADALKSRSSTLEVSRLVVKTDGGTVFGEVALSMSGALDVPVEELREGHVLAEDLKTPTGALLLPVATRLTQGLVERLRNTLKGTRVRACLPEGAGR